MKINFLELFKQLAISIVTICIIGLLVLFILSEFTPATICESYCKQHNGTYWQATDCEGNTTACAGWCEIPNETISCEKIFANITSLESYV